MTMKDIETQINEIIKMFKKLDELFDIDEEDEIR